MSLSRVTALAFLLLTGPAASAEEPAAPTVEAGPAPGPRFELDGRVYVRETFSDDEGSWGAQTSIASARVGLRYQRKHLRSRVQVELRSSARLRHAWLEVVPSAELSVRAGLFKIPLSPFELASSWRLPVAERGLVSEILRDRLQIAGRRVGAAIAWTPGAAADGAPPGTWALTARAGYFQGLDDLGELLDEAAADGFGKVGTVRVELGPFGATGQVRQGRPDVLAPSRTAWAGSVDATLELSRLRLWLEATLGSSWLVAPGRQDARFLETRGVAAWRVGGAKGGAPYLEPYVLLGLVDPDGALAGDLVLETTAGVNLGMWKRWRLQLELEIWRFGAHVPMGFVAPATMPADRTAVVTQLGASF